MNKPERFTSRELALCARREVVQRKRVYGHLVAQGKLDSVTAALEIAKMEEIQKYFENLDQPNLL